MLHSTSFAGWRLRTLAVVLAFIIGLGALAGPAAAGRIPRSNPGGSQPVSQNQDTASRPPRSNGGDSTSTGRPNTRPARDNSGGSTDNSGRPPRGGSSSGGSTGGTTGGSTGGTTPTNGGTDTGTSSGACLAGQDAEMLALINNFRAQNGVGPLTESPTLTHAASYHSSDMANRNYFSHDLPGVGTWSDNISNYGYPSMGRAENIAAGNTSAEATFQQWVNSPGHLANMLNPSYTAIGIGDATNSSSQYGTYWTTDFGDTVDAVGC